MKTLYLSLILMAVGILIVPSVHNVSAIPYMSPQDLYKASDMVFHGQVISKQAGPGPDYYYYQIKVDTFFKNPQTSDSVTVAGHKPTDGHMEYPQFEIGDKALFYTSKINGVNTIGLFSQKAGMVCTVQSFLGSAYVPDNTRPISGAASNPRITDINGNAVVGNVSRGQPVQITYDEIWNNYPEYKAIQLHMSIQNAVDTKPAFEENRTVFLNACDGPSPVKLNFVPEKNGTYVFSLNIDGKLTTGTSFEVGGPAYSGSMVPSSPLKQFKSGIGALDVTCKTGLQLVIKSEDLSPACVTPDTSSILVKRGWTHDNIILPKNMSHIVIPPLNDTGKLESTNENKTSSPLQLFLSIDSEYQNPSEPITIDVGLNNTGSVPLTLTKSDNWPRNDMSSGLCSNLPFGISILKGYYTEQNMSSAKSLVIYGLVPCPLPTVIKSYTFDPLSNKATQECDSLFSCPGLTDMKAHLVIPDFMNNGQHHSFDVGTYTIVAGDEWGHVMIKHFTEEYATAYSGPLEHN